MNDENEPPLFEPDANLPPDPFPQSELADRTCRLYVASALTRLSDASEEEARLLEGELDTIKQAVTSLDYDGVGFSMEAYAPIEHSSAHRHTDLTPEQVFEQNCLEVLTRSDGLIVHGWQPGAGVGQEFTWAATLAALPVLWVQHGDNPVSRQIRGTPGDVTFERFDRPADLRQLVQEWLRSRRAVLGAGPYRRTNRAMRWQGPATAARRRWMQLDEAERRRISATGNVVPAVIDFYLSNPLLLAVAPAWILDMLSTEGLLIATSATQRPAGGLSTRQLLALVEAAKEYDWEMGLVDYLRTSAEQVMAEPVTRRLKLDTPADWVRLRETLRP